MTKDTDIVEHLRFAYRTEHKAPSILDAAADEIERLRAENERLRAEVERLQSTLNTERVLRLSHICPVPEPRIWISDNTGPVEDKP